MAGYKELLKKYQAAEAKRAKAIDFLFATTKQI